MKCIFRCWDSELGHENCLAANTSSTADGPATAKHRRP